MDGLSTQTRYKLRPRNGLRVRQCKQKAVSSNKKSTQQKKCKRRGKNISGQNSCGSSSASCSESKRELSDSEKVGMQCVICLDTEYPHNYYTLPCGHRFHRGCLSTWLLDEDSCPVCRDELDMKEFMDFVGNKINFMNKLYSPMHRLFKMNVCPCLALD